MAKITALENVDEITGDELIPIVQAGRTKRSTMAALRDIITPYLQNWYKGDRGETGLAANTFTDLAAFKSAPTDQFKSAQLVGISGIADGTFHFETANAPYADDGTDTIKADDTDLSVGAWVRSRERSSVPYVVPYNRILSDRSMDRITVRDFGADTQPVGSGNPDWDTAGFKRALDFMANYRTATVSPGGSPVYTGPAMRVPAGVHFLNQPMTADVPHAERILFRGEGVNASVLRLMGDFHAIETDHRLESSFVSGLTLIGGRGLLHHTFTGDNVSTDHIIQDCLFFDYSGAAICSEATDMPYWTIERCIFGGGGTVGAGLTRGVVLGGLQDGSVIRGNKFLSNEFHVILGPVASGSWHLDDNDFLSVYVENRTINDVWLRPHDGSVTAASPAGKNLFRVESGNGSSISGNKFGNEGVTSITKKAAKILIAAAGPGDRASAMPDLSWKNGTDGKHYLGGISVGKNRFITAGNLDANVVDVWVNALDRINWEETNSYDGGSFRYIVEHKSSSRVPDKNNMSWNVTIPASGAPNTYGFTNSPVGLINDRSGSDAGGFSIVPGAGVDPTAATVLAVTTPEPWSALGGVTKAATTNIDGQNDATRFTFDGSDAALQLVTGNINANANRAGFLVTAYRSDTARQFRFTIGANSRDFVDRVITLRASPDRYAPLTIPFPLPGDVTGCVLTFTAVSPVAGSVADFADLKLGAGKSAPTL